MKDLLKTKSPEFTEAQKQEIEELYNGLGQDGFCPVILSVSRHHIQIMHLDGEGGTIKMLILNNNGKLVAHQQ